MKYKILLILLFILYFTSLRSYSTETANQVITSRLGEVLEISKIIVDEVEFDINAPLINVKKEKTTRSIDSTQVLLSPIQVRIHTNLSTPISISAEFQELNHNENLHQFASEDLSFSPSKITINNPYDNIITGEFIPKVNVNSDAKKGIYTGKILFTLGAI